MHTRTHEHEGESVACLHTCTHPHTLYMYTKSLHPLGHKHKMTTEFVVLEIIRQSVFPLKSNSSPFCRHNRGS